MGEKSQVKQILRLNSRTSLRVADRGKMNSDLQIAE